MAIPIVGPASATAAAVTPDHIQLVQRLIERCLAASLIDKDECAWALYSQAGIPPALTRIVWDQLERQNEDFFREYNAKRLAQQQEGVEPTTYSPTSASSTVRRRCSQSDLRTALDSLSQLSLSCG
eukprot:jgi/Chlat1/350/Chrsp10S01472